MRPDATASPDHAFELKAVKRGGDAEFRGQRHGGHCGREARIVASHRGDRRWLLTPNSTSFYPAWPRDGRSGQKAERSPAMARITRRYQAEGGVDRAILAHNEILTKFDPAKFPVVGQFVRVTPAMAADISKTLWPMIDVVRIVDEWEIAQKVT